MIPNPLIKMTGRQSSLDSKVVISAGRLVPSKQFDALIRIWERVHVVRPDWRLEIYGGGNQSYLQTYIDSLGLSDSVFLKGFAADLPDKMVNSALFCLTSRHEGFAMVLVEAMSCGLPVVSYDCQCGPSDIIDDGIDGFLIKAGDEAGMAGAILKLIDDDHLRIEMGKRAIGASSKYDIASISSLWMHLFTQLLSGCQSN